MSLSFRMRILKEGAGCYGFAGFTLAVLCHWAAIFRFGRFTAMSPPKIPFRWQVRWNAV